MQSTSSNTTVNPSLQEERDKIDFNQKQLSTMIWGGEEKYAKHQAIMKFFANDPVLRNKPAQYDFTREEVMVDAFKRMNRIFEVYNFDEINY